MPEPVYMAQAVKLRRWNGGRAELGFCSRRHYEKWGIEVTFYKNGETFFIDEHTLYLWMRLRPDWTKDLFSSVDGYSYIDTEGDEYRRESQGVES